MAKLELRGYLPHEDKPEKFEKFRKIASEIYNEIDGHIIFSWEEKFEQLDNIENKTKIDYIDLKNMLGNDSKYLI